MQKRKIAIVLFCVVSSVVMSSCVKKTLETANAPVVAAAKFVGHCAASMFKYLKPGHAGIHHIPHAHVSKSSGVVPDGDAPESK